MTAVTVTYWLNGNKIRERHPNAESFERRSYGEEEFDVLLNADKQILASYKSASVVAVQYEEKNT
jgi:hypothetical protein